MKLNRGLGCKLDKCKMIPGRKNDRQIKEK